jgi:hypothetical protein
MANFEFKSDIDWTKIEKLIGNEEIKIGFINGSPHVGGVSSVDLAQWLSHGTATIPARPFLEEGIQDGQPEISKMIERHYKTIVERGAKDPTGLHAIAVTAVGAIKKFVFGDHYKSTIPNAKSTALAKGSDTPLVDTGQLVNSLNYVVNETAYEEKKDESGVKTWSAV